VPNVYGQDVKQLLVAE